jgi:SulP family sulfate permease
MRPRAAVLGLHEDGTLRDAIHFRLPELHPKIGAVRFDGPLYFVNVAYFEEAILQVARDHPHLEYILIVGSGITDIDASGVETLSVVVERLRANGITPVFSGLKLQITRVMQETGLQDRIGSENLFRTDDGALAHLRQRVAST